MAARHTKIIPEGLTTKCRAKARDKKEAVTQYTSVKPQQKGGGFLST